MASSAGLVPLPTSVHHSTTRLTHFQAHTFLSAFLDRAENDAAYRPDSTLTERGPQALSSGSTPNLTLTHLKRILSGIEGKRIGGSLGLGERVNGEGENTSNGELEGSDEGQMPRKQGSQKRALNEDEQTNTVKKQKRKIVYSVNAEGVEDPQVGADVEAETPGQARGDDDWQDAETYALAQTELNDDDAAGGEDALDFEGDDEDDDEREWEEREATDELDDDSDASEAQRQTTTIRKRKQRGGDQDADGAGGEQKTKKKKAANTDTDTVPVPATAQRSTMNGAQVVSKDKDERRKLKKMRRKDEKRERQREREQKKKKKQKNQ
ncbi:hypothetical protein AYL99_10779 [Fonsecaea erecta]|uniref:Uncharacterized protein n=1 Tax=Fonsecaea erecta TaxID=1367422 RepID=A0A178Z5P2_9EURO|nr:hypothetical protein AYL99_10779 [Fonsecaea erecta]OAP55079.1 hypothetical protein AYL99_10779 [Fonsecaea erecta]